MLNELSEEMRNKLNDLERREWHKVLRSNWWLTLSRQVAELVKDYPPFYIYVMKDTKEFVYITEYLHSKEEADQPVLLQVKLDPKYNDGATITKLIIVAPHVLERIELRCVVDAESIVAERNTRSIYMPGLANRAQALRKSRDVRAQANLEMIKFNLKKGH